MIFFELDFPPCHRKCLIYMLIRDSTPSGAKESWTFENWKGWWHWFDKDNANSWVQPVCSPFTEVVFNFPDDIGPDLHAGGWKWDGHAEMIKILPCVGEGKSHDSSNVLKNCSADIPPINLAFTFINGTSSCILKGIENWSKLAAIT